ncbi:hypothetical protein HK097_009296 [Rhizophlyctis rosea]|uniref:BTB domain-containing protein n=1 Tax=Rhizophlyctis rosea TaxID=64517 RepID=A0AAD5S947_9FUNG|nr:hypothetical protein HK097_009296 [Rhizophlyctis rosea]
MSTSANREDYSDLVDLDVGGKHFRTTRTTLAIPEVFQIILDYLRTATIDQHLPADQDQRHHLLLLLPKEAENFQLTGLCDLLIGSYPTTSQNTAHTYPTLSPGTDEEVDFSALSTDQAVALRDFVDEENQKIAADGSNYCYEVQMVYALRDDETFSAFLLLMRTDPYP